MSIDNRAASDPAPLRWPRPRPKPEGGSGHGASTTLRACLLDADDELAAELDVRARAAARGFAVARVLVAPVGERDLAPWFDAVGDGLGLLILDGLVAVESSVGDRTATELLGCGDLLQPSRREADELLACTVSWHVLCASRLALLDGDFAERVSPWPQLVQELLRRSGRRTAEVDVLRAISCQPRLELRLVLLLWHLAGRWGRVEPAGIRITLPLTHRLLGQLVAAERPSVSHALARLSHAGLVTGVAGDLHLSGTLEGHLESLLDRPAAAAGVASTA